MIKPEETHHHSLPYYSAAIMPAFMAVPFLFYGAIVFAVAALLIGLVSVLSTRHLVLSIKRTNQQKFSMDQQLLQSQKLASIGELSSGIAHEINNPLAIIGQEVEWVLHMVNAEAIKNLKETAEIKDSLHEIRRQVDRCKEITHKLLDFARKKEPLIQAVDLNKLIEDMTKLVEREATSKGIKIVREYGKDLPLLSTDAPLLRQVILNLLINATYAVEKEGLISVGSALSGADCIEIRVSDNGCGIPREHLDKIFDPFFTTKPPGKGTGLGLSISHGIVTKLGGLISVASEVGGGSTFTIRLPIDRGKEKNNHVTQPKNSHSGRRGEVPDHAG